MLKRLRWVVVAVPALVAFLVFWGGAASGNLDNFEEDDDTPAISGIYDFKDANFGNGLTECPQAGKIDEQPQPLDRRDKDAAEKVSNNNDRRANQDYSCFPQDETSIAVNPTNSRNLVGGANDYRLGWGTSGFYSSTDNGQHWYDGIIPFPSLPSGDNLDGGGDPAVVFDRQGVVYWVDINFNRTDDTNGLFVSRSTNGGFTWTRPCVAAGSPPACGGPGDVRQPGDGTISFYQDNDTLANGSVPFNDKEYAATGPRPAGVPAQCYTPSHTPTACNAAVVSPDRLYVTWSLFSPSGSAQIYESHSDDQGRSWSPGHIINGSAIFCAAGGRTGNECADNQGSTPTVNPTTGFLYVSFLNGDTTDEDQYLVVRSRDGGQTFEGPFFVTPIYDLNYPRGRNGRTDCVARGQSSSRAVLTNSCFRVNSYGNMVVDPRGGAYADDLYLVIDDNRNGTIRSSNVDVFLFKSTDGGTTWVGPTRVNDDASTTPPNRDCGRNTNSTRGDLTRCPNTSTGNDQWFPWVTINTRGDLNVVFNDRRLDTDSTASEWPTSRGRPGNYLVWFWGAQCTVSAPDSRDCVAPTATAIPQPTAPIDPGPTDDVANQTVFPFRNFTISDSPNNWDYSFRAGIFAGDYSNVVSDDSRAYALWTDARNGRSSRTEVGRNPICEQSDVFFDSYSSRGAGAADKAKPSDSLFLVTPCPTQAIDKGNRQK